MLLDSAFPSKSVDSGNAESVTNTVLYPNGTYST